MKMSAEINEIASALVLLQAEVANIFSDTTVTVKKNGVKQFDYKHPKLDAILHINKPIWTKHKLAIIQSPSKCETSNKASLETLVAHTSGQWIIFEMNIDVSPSSQKSHEQSHGAAITYMRRYSLCPILGISATDDDDCALDNNASSDTETTKKAKESSINSTTEKYSPLMNRKILAACTIDELFSIYKTAYRAAQQEDNCDEILEEITKAKDYRKKYLENK